MLTAKETATCVIFAFTVILMVFLLLSPAARWKPVPHPAGSAAGAFTVIPEAKIRMFPASFRDNRSKRPESAENDAAGKAPGKTAGSYIRHQDLPKDAFLEGVTAWLRKNTSADEKTAKTIAREAWRRKNGLLLVAMASVESDARPGLKHANNYGLCQVSTVHLDPSEMARVEKIGHRSLRNCGVSSRHDLFDVGRNLCAADAIFERILSEAGGDAKTALVNYNANPRHKYRYRTKVWKRYKDLRRTVKGLAAG